MKRRRTQRAIPERLGVVVRVQVNEARAHHQVSGVDGLARWCVDFSDVGNATVFHSDVGVQRCCTGAVDNSSATNHHVVHGQ